MQRIKLTIAMGLGMGVVAVCAQAGGTGDSGGGGACATGGVFAACPANPLLNMDPDTVWAAIQAENHSGADNSGRRRWLALFPSLARLRGKGRWEAQWSMVGENKEHGINLAIDGGRPWVNMAMGKMELDLELNSPENAQLFLGVGTRW